MAWRCRAGRGVQVRAEPCETLPSRDYIFLRERSSRPSVLCTTRFGRLAGSLVLLVLELVGTLRHGAFGAAVGHADDVAHGRVGRNLRVCARKCVSVFVWWCVCSVVRVTAVPSVRYFPPGQPM